jgi:hypothetical protein
MIISVYCEPLSSISFESTSRLNRVESYAFTHSSLKSIEIPRNIQFIDDSTFLGVSLDLSLTMNFLSILLIVDSSNSRLQRTETMALSELHFCVVIPSLILFIASNAAPNVSQVMMADCHSCLSPFRTSTRASAPRRSIEVHWRLEVALRIVSPSADVKMASFASNGSTTRRTSRQTSGSVG